MHASACHTAHACRPARSLNPTAQTSRPHLITVQPGHVTGQSAVTSLQNSQSRHSTNAVTSSSPGRDPAPAAAPGTSTRYLSTWSPIAARSELAHTCICCCCCSCYTRHTQPQYRTPHSVSWETAAAPMPVT
eukprot:1050534-Rhodomonas_salina.2